MKITHKHFDSIPTTQQLLIELINSGEDTNLVSTKAQSAGVGRRGNQWDQYNNSISLSLKLNVSELKEKTITPLAIGVGVCTFLNKHYSQNQVRLKWPNDILNKNNEKVGGIICKLINDIAIIGIGINIGKSSNESQYRTRKGYILDIELSDDDYKTIPYELMKTLLNRSLSHDIEEWESMCAHQDAIVKIIDEDKSISGKFIGIGKYGEALLLRGENIQKVFNGSLILH